MSAKEYLSQIRDSDAYINNKRAELDQLRELSRTIKSQPTDSERVQTSARNSQEELLIKIIDMEQQIKVLIDEYVNLKGTIIRQLEELRKDSPVYYAVLHKKYIQFLSLGQIAREMNYSYDWMKRLHGKALQKFELMKEDTKRHL